MNFLLLCASLFHYQSVEKGRRSTDVVLFYDENFNRLKLKKEADVEKHAGFFYLKID